MKHSVAIATATFNRKKAPFSSKLDLNLTKKLTTFCNWSIALYGAENWIFLKIDRNIWNLSKCGVGKG